MRLRSRVGSSPLTRGKQGDGPFRLPERGLIPAHAGKTMRPAYRRSRRKAHPRSRGENQTHTRVRQTTGGSSPLTRGKPLTQFKLSGSDGLIPAHAGKTSRPRLRSRRQRAHPRSRGENVEGGHFRPFRWGSSPLTRGKRSRLWKWCRRRRLIPAHAGKTLRAAWRSSAVSGSSPLTRGKQQGR